ncbi:cell division protein FtsL [Roseospira navarrensis]|uniref:Cell division protein FtsL n=1 Tax=Roseospira navarrensis TaxID=140058 RepID=A0A7X1ZEB5_9PROT|nr:hypothetical protein [Roseospira navarrensis]MQX36732.1 hypothetical protein [Roseospira navarrensis]
MTIRGTAALWGVLAVAAATGLFLLKYEVIALEGKLERVTEDIEADRRAIHVLRAEWSYLNEPDALDRLVGRHLDLVPVGPERMTVLDAIPLRPRPPAVDQAGAALPFDPVRPPRVLYPGTTHAIPLPGEKPTVLADAATMRTEP